MLTFQANPAHLPAVAAEKKWGEKWGEKWGSSLLAKRQKMIEAMMINSRVTITQLAAQLGLGTSAIENHLKAMQSQGCIKRIGPAKGGHWEVIK